MSQSPRVKKASVKIGGTSPHMMVGFNVPTKFRDPDFMSRVPVFQRVMKIGGKHGVLMQTEISHSRHKVYITCVETDSVRSQHVFDMWKKQAERLLE